MYDPLVVDTFLAVYAEITPPSEPVQPQFVLRANVETAQGPRTVSAPAQRFEEIAASTEEMLTLFDLARGLSNQMSVQDAGDVIAKHVRRLVPCSLCIFFLYDVDSDELVAGHAAGDNASMFAGLRIGRGERLSGWVAANRQSIRNSDPVLDLGEYVRSVQARPRSCLSTPMTVGGSLVGVLSLYSIAPEAFSEEHQRILEVVSRQVSAILKGAAEFDRTKAVSFRDQLTGLPNIEQLHQLAREEQTIEQVTEPVSVLLIDVQGLERINVQHGRHEGDAILRKVVRAARRSLRAADVLFRFRDDELLALLLHTDRRTAALITSRVQDAIKSEASEHGTPRFEATIITLSAPEDGRSIAQLVERAGRALPNNPVDSSGPSYPSPSIH